MIQKFRTTPESHTFPHLLRIQQGPGGELTNILVHVLWSTDTLDLRFMATEDSSVDCNWVKMLELCHEHPRSHELGLS
jgi:hypothetical protein